MAGKSINLEDIDRHTVLGFAARIPWDKFVGAGATGPDNLFLTGEDVRVIKRIAAEPPASVAALLAAGDADALAFAPSLIKVVCNIQDVRIAQYVLTLALDFLEADPERRTALFVRAGLPAGSPPSVTPFLQMVGTTGAGAVQQSIDVNPYVLEHAALVSAHLLSVDRRDEASVSAMLAWVFTNIKLFGSLAPRQVKVTEVAAEAMRLLLRNDFLRALFVAELGVHRLVAMLAAVNAQILYSAAFGLWLLSLNKGLIHDLVKAGAVTAAARLCRAGQPLKVVRMCLALLANIGRSGEGGETALIEIAESHVPEVVAGLAAADPPPRDPELMEDVRWLAEALRGSKRVLTSVERYERELETGHLEWSAVHSSEFWAANAAAFERDGFRTIRALRDLLVDEGSDEVTLAVALHDLGEFAAAHPQGRAVLTSLSVRPLVMSFLNREEDDVKQQALLATSKIMTAQWRAVAGAGGASPPGAAAAGGGR